MARGYAIDREEVPLLQITNRKKAATGSQPAKRAARYSWFPVAGFATGTSTFYPSIADGDPTGDLLIDIFLCLHLQEEHLKEEHLEFFVMGEFNAESLRLQTLERKQSMSFSTIVSCSMIYEYNRNWTAFYLNLMQ